MKTFAKILTGVTLVLALFAAYLYLGGNVRVRLVSAQRESAEARADAFSNVRESARRGEAGVALLSGDISENAAEYDFVTLTYEIANYGLLPAEWLRIRLSPEVGDAAQVLGEEIDVRALGRANFTTVLLTRKDSDADARSARAEYYLYGRARNVPAR